MRATNLCFRSPREPNTQYHQDIERKLKDIPFEKHFPKEDRFTHGSIYDMPFHATTRKVGPGAYKSNIRKPKPTSVKMKLAEIERFTGTQEKNFEIVNNMRILHAGNLHPAQRNSLHNFTDQNAIRANFNLNLTNPNFTLEHLTPKVCPKYLASQTPAARATATTVHSNGKFTLGSNGSQQPTTDGPSSSRKKASSRLLQNQNRNSSKRYSKQQHTTFDDSPRFRPKSDFYTAKEIRQSVQQNGGAFSQTMNTRNAAEEVFDRFRSNTGLERRTKQKILHSQATHCMPNSNIACSLKATLAREGHHCKEDRMLENYMGAKISGSRSLTQAGFSRIRQQVVKRSVNL